MEHTHLVKGLDFALLEKVGFMETVTVFSNFSVKDLQSTPRYVHY